MRHLAPLLSVAVRRRNAFGAVCLCCLLVNFGAAPRALAQYRFDSWTADDGLPQNIIRAIHQTPDGYLWLVTLDGLVRFDGVRFTVFDKGNSPGINSNRFTCLYEDAEGALWVGTENGGVTRYSGGRFVTYTTEHGLPHNFIRGITGDESGNLWVLSAQRVMRWDGGRFTPADLLGLKTDFQNSEWDTGVFWGADETGLHRFAHGQLTTRPFPGNLLRRVSERFEEDTAGTIWAVMRDGSIAKVRGGKVVKGFKIGEVLPGPGRGMLANPEMEFNFRDHQEHLWAVDVGSGLNRSVTLSSSGRPERIAFNTFFEDREGNLWLGTNGQGLYRLRKQAITVYSKQHGLVDRNVYPIYEDRAGAVWIGAWPGGLSQFKDGSFTNYTRDWRWL